MSAPMSAQMASSLPSFIQLMASLGLDNDAKPSPPNTTPSRSRSGSSSSLSSHGSPNPASSPLSPSVDTSSESVSRDVDVDRRAGSSRLRSVRFSPYASPNASARQSSSTSIDDMEHEQSSASPRLSPSPARNRPSPLLSPKSSRELHAPISGYARRRTPQNSPTAATFPHRLHADRPETIVLPSLLPAPVSH